MNLSDLPKNTARPENPENVETEPALITFKPLSEGLGFHPFSDGLPYAPQTPKPGTQPTQLRAGNMLMGTGAESAGPPRFAFPRVTVPAARLPITPPLSVPLAAPAPIVTNFSSAAALSPSQTLQTPRTPRPLYVSSNGYREAPETASTPLPSVSALPEPLAALELSQNQRGVGYVARRVTAWFIDSCVHFTFGFCGLAAVVWNQPALSPSSLDLNVVLLVGGFLLLLNWALITSQEVIFKTTFGKRLFNLRLDDAHPVRIFFRSLIWILSAGLCGLGLVWCLFDRHRRCWHDLMTGTDVIEC